MADPWANDFPSTFDVGTPGAGHMHFGSDGSMVLYGPDGTTILTSLTPANGLDVFKGTVTGAVVQTAPSGKRIALDGTLNEITMASGAGGETAGDLNVGYTAAAGNAAPYIEADAPVAGGVQATFRLQSSSSGGVIPRQAEFGVDVLSVTGNVDCTDVNSTGAVFDSSGQVYSPGNPPPADTDSWSALTGKPFTYLTFGQAFVTLDGSGLAAFAHGMSVTPTIAVVTHFTGGGAGAAVSVAVTSIDATNIHIHASIVSQNANFFWVALHA